MNKPRLVLKILNLLLPALKTSKNEALHISQNVFSYTKKEKLFKVGYGTGH